VRRLPLLMLPLLLLLSSCVPGSPSTVPLAFTESGVGPVVVLLHGHPQTAASWRAVVPRLAQRYRVLVVDQRGQGASPAPADGYDARTRARDVAALLRRLSVTRASVVGTDLGGQTAYALAHDDPGLVSRLAVLEAVVPGTRAAAGPLAAPHIARFTGVDAQVRSTLGREDAHVRGFVCAGRDPCPYPPDLLVEAGEALRRPGHLRGAFAPYTELVAPFRSPGRLPGSVPVLAVGGGDGVGLLPEQSLREVADNVRGVVLPGASHWLAEEQPQALLAALEPFLAGR